MAKLNNLMFAYLINARVTTVERRERLCELGGGIISS